MKNRPFLSRLRYALSGIAATWHSEKSFRTHTVFGAGALAILAARRPSPVWWAIFLVVIGGVLAAELFNTALERVVDRLHPESHPSIAMAKDCAAGAVLILGIASLGVLIAMFLS